MTKEYDSRDLLRYALAYMERRRYATAQAFWVFAFERFIKENVRKQGVVLDNDYTAGEIIRIAVKEQKKSWFIEKKDVLFEMNDWRRCIVHEGFVGDSDLERLVEELGFLIFEDNKSLKTRCFQVNAEGDTDLAIKLGDRKVYPESEVGKYSTIEKNDFGDYALFEKKVWAIKYRINCLLKADGETGGLKTGLISQLYVESEWIWIPVGFNIGEKNERVRKPIISVLILMRSRVVRVYLDFGTKTTGERKTYYDLLISNDKGFRKLLRDFCCEYPSTEFWNVEHYSRIVDKIPVMKWLEGEPTCCEEIKRLIDKKKRNLMRKDEQRNNILLFGREITLEHFPCDMGKLAADIVQIVKKLAPFLQMIERHEKQCHC